MKALRALVDRDVLLSVVPLVRAISRNRRLEPVDGLRFYTEDKRLEYRRRIESVTSQSPRQWGTMEVDEMLRHLNMACGASLGFYDVRDESDPLSRTVGKWITVEWLRELPIGLRIPKGFKIKPARRFDVEQEKAQLLTIVETAWRATTDDAWTPHALFGKMTPRQWGKLFQIHLDYHLRQFGA